MGYQLSLFDKYIKTEEDNSKIRILFWNIQNPSLQRTANQIEWIDEINPNIIVLTEVKDSKGFENIKGGLEFREYEVVYNRNDSYFTAIALRGIKYIEKDFRLKKSSERVLLLELETIVGKINILGLYAPSNGMDEQKMLLKKEFHDDFISQLNKKFGLNNNNSNFIIGGDFNVLQPNHKPRDHRFEKWNYFYQFLEDIGLVDIYQYLNPGRMEYTWEFQDMHQRLDYAFVSRSIIERVIKCEYLHYPRVKNLSDHSALVIELE